MGTKLYVGNLSYDTSEAGLKAAFEADGRVVQEVAVIIDRDTGRSRGFGFVTMGSPTDAQAAMQALDGFELDGRQLRVSEARERERRGPGGPPGNGRPAGGPPRDARGFGNDRGGGGNHRGDGDRG
jgi:RNA recognition motif-containing protein